MASNNTITAAQPNQTVEVTLAAGQATTLDVGNATIEGVTLGEAGALVVHLSNKSTIVVKNFADLEMLSPVPTLTLSNGQTVDLAKLKAMESPAVADVAQADTAPTLVAAPQANETLVVKLEPNGDYRFDFALTEPTAVKETAGQLVITFANGGEIVIPDYTALKTAGWSPAITLKDGAELPASDMGELLASATQLNQIEAAAGESGSAGSGGGFGFQSAFQYTPFDSIVAVGPINPTELAYEAPDREPYPTIERGPGPSMRPPALEANDLYVKEDGSGQLVVKVAADQPDQSVTIKIEGIDPSWGVDTSTSGGTYDPATGTWTHTIMPGQTYNNGPTFSPPADSDVDMTGLIVTATAMGPNGVTTSTVGVNIYVDAVADMPTLSASASGDEDTAIPLVINTAATDVDGSEEITLITISGVPAGATLNNGVDQGGGVWHLTPADLAGLTITPPANFSGDMPLTITSTATETQLGDREWDLTDNEATVSIDIVVNVRPVADAPDLEVRDAYVKEDGSIGLEFKADLTDADGSEALTITISGIPSDWGVDARGGSYDVATGTWTITLPAGQNFNSIADLGGADLGPVLSPPADSDVDLTGLVVTATSTETANGDAASTADTLDVLVDAVVDQPLLDAQNVWGREVDSVALNISTSATDTDGSEEITRVTIENVPAGFSFATATGTPVGTDLGGGVWEFTQADLAGLHIVPTTGWTGTINLKVTSTAEETALNGVEWDLTDNTATVETNFNFTMKPPVADAPVLKVTDAWVKEDSKVADGYEGKLNIEASPVDANESLTITIEGIPSDWVLTDLAGGTYNAATGTWTITLPEGQSYNNGPTFAPPADSDADLTGLVVTATATVGDESASTVVAGNVFVDAVADVPFLSASSNGGDEDTAIALNIDTSPRDTDGSEAITLVVVSNVPAGSVLSAGVDQGGGVWHLTPADLAGLTITPPQNWSGVMTVNVRSYAEEVNLSGSEQDYSDNVASAELTVKIPVRPVADVPTLNVTDLYVKEDGSGQLIIDAAPTDPKEYLTITIEGIDPSWGVDTSTSGGTYDPATGTWTITLPPGQSYNGGPTFSPPADSDVDLTNLTVTATSTDTDGSSVSVNETVNIYVDAVADVPDLVAGVAGGDEDTAIPLNITTSVTDTDGSEEITTIVISGVPAGATLNNGVETSPGVWTLTPADLDGLTITPPHNWSGTFELTVTSTAEEVNLDGDEWDLTDNTATATVKVPVTVNPVADAPVLKVKDAYVKEDGSVAMNITANLTDTDGSEYLTITVEGIQPGWGVDTSTSGGTYNAATGTWTITLPAGVNFAGGPTLSPPADSDVDMRGLRVTATSTEAANGHSATTAGVANVYVDAVIDAPYLNVTDVSADEGAEIALTIDTGVSDADGSESITEVVISGVPAGFTFSAGTDRGDGSWVFTKEELAGLKVNPPAGWTGTLNLTVASTAEEAVQENDPNNHEWDFTDNVATVTKPLTITVAPGLCEPTLKVVDQYIKEDTSATLDIQVSPDRPTDSLTITVSGIDSTWTVSDLAGGTYNAANGTWSITLAAGESFNGGPTLVPPADSDADLTGLVVTATATDANGNTASVTAPTNVFVDAVIDEPTLELFNYGVDDNGLAAVWTDEDTAVAINIRTNVTDTDGSEEITLVTIENVPEGFTFSAGTNIGGGIWHFTKAELAGLKMTPAKDWSGRVYLKITSTAEETNLSGQEWDYSDNKATVETQLKILVAAVADKPKLTVKDLCIKEDGSGQMLVDARLTDTDGSEFLKVSISGIQPGWTVDTSASGGTYNAATGTWSITLPAGQNFYGGPVFHPPADSDADMTGLVVTATSQETPWSDSTATVTATANVYVDAVADAPDLSASNAAGRAGDAIALNIATAVTDTDGSEAITRVTITGVPAGATLNNGSNQGNGVWYLTEADLAGLTITLPNSFSGTLNLGVKSTATEVNLSGQEWDYSDNSAHATTTLKVVVAPCVTVEAPTLCVSDAWVKEDGKNAGDVFKGKLLIAADPQDNGDILTITVSGIQSGWKVTDLAGGTFNAANGTWSITLAPGQSFNNGPTFLPPKDSDVDMRNLTVTATARQGGLSASATEKANVFVDAVADVPNLNVQDLPTQHWNIYQKIEVPLNVSAAVTDTDGSERITHVIIKLNNNFTKPAGGYRTLDDMGVSLNKGVEIAPGVWKIDVNAGNTAAALNGLKMIVPKGDGTFGGPLHHATTGTHKVNITVEAHVYDKPTDSERDLSDNTATAIKNISFKFMVTPLVLDLNGNGAEFVSQDAGVMFDMDNDGVLDRTSWVAATDGMLAIDLNGDGVINNQSELFGNNDQYADGFANLAQYDTNGDGKIDANDEVFGKLRVWQDLNQDGISQENELFGLDHYGIESISLDVVEGGEASGDVKIAYTGSFNYANGETGTIVDALFNVTDGATGHIGATLTGTDNNDVIYGTDKDDVISGGAGNDILYGGAGADTFLFTDIGGVDTVKDFSLEEGDVLDISGILEGYDPLTQALEDYVNVFSEGEDTIVQVDTTGTGTEFHTIAVLEGVRIDLDTLSNNGNLIA